MFKMMRAAGRRVAVWAHGRLQVAGDWSHGRTDAAMHGELQKMLGLFDPLRRALWAHELGARSRAAAHLDTANAHLAAHADQLAAADRSSTLASNLTKLLTEKL